MRSARPQPRAAWCVVLPWLLALPSAAPAAPAAEAAPGSASARSPGDPGEQAPTVGGLSGLVRVVSADVGARHSFRLGLHVELLHRSGFLVDGDRHDRLLGTLALAYTPWRYLELFAQLRSQANQNTRPAGAERRDAEVIFALGDLSLGGKLRLPVAPYLAVGGQLELALLNSVGGVFYDGAATGLYLGGLTSLHLDALEPRLPLRLHANLGYRLDRSAALRDFPAGYDLASLQVEKFALGVNRSRLQLKLGAEGLLARWTRVDLRPLVEWAVDLATGSADGDFAGRVPADDFDGRWTSWITVGARVRPLRGLNVTLASDLGLLSPGFGHGPPLPAWNLIAGLSFAYDPVAPRPAAGAACSAAPRTPPCSAATATSAGASGRIRGQVLHADTLAPIAGVVVTFPGRALTAQATGADGSFLTYELPAGTAQLAFRHDAYVATQTAIAVRPGTAIKLQVLLQPALPRSAALAGRVADSGGRGLSATLALVGPQTLTLASAPNGDFKVPELAPGDYALTVSAAGHIALQQRLSLAEGRAQQLDLTLKPAPAALGDRSGLVRATTRTLSLRRKIHFASGRATLRHDAQRLLDVLADVLLASPQYSRVEIQGHTDSNGAESTNRRLSQARAEAVREHLIARGVSADRLTARGYGASRPTHPNISAQNREANRRVEFHLR